MSTTPPTIRFTIGGQTISVTPPLQIWEEAEQVAALRRLLAATQNESCEVTAQDVLMESIAAELATTEAGK